MSIVDHCHCFIFACGTYLLQVNTAHDSYFDVSITSFANAFAWRPQVEKSLRAPTVSVTPLGLDRAFTVTVDKKDHTVVNWV